MFRPGALEKVVHEVAHLQFESMFSKKFVDRFAAQGVGFSLDPEEMEEEYTCDSEIFCDTMVGLLVFGREVDAFTKCQLTTIRNLRSELGSRSNSRFQTLVLAGLHLHHRLFVVDAVLRSLWSTEQNIEPKLGGEEFLDFLKRHIHPQDIAHLAPLDMYLEAASQFGIAVQQAIKGIVKVLEPEICLAWRVHQAREQMGATTEQLLNELKEDLASGTPLGVRRYESLAVEEGVAVRALLRHYLKLDNELADVAETRTARYLLSLSIMKSLWHISTRQRRRRFRGLLKDSAEFANSNWEQIDRSLSLPT